MNYREQYYRENNIYDIARSFMIAGEDTRYEFWVIKNSIKNNQSK